MSTTLPGQARPAVVSREWGMERAEVFRAGQDTIVAAPGAV
ncbi:hypothetical protein [Streptomyces sp. NPDC054849]